MKNTDLTILVITREETLLNLVEGLQNNDTDYNIIFVNSLKEFFECLRNQKIDMVIFDPDVKDLNPVDAFTVAKFYYPRIPAIYLFEEEDYATSSAIIDKGVLFRILKPLKKQDLEQICKTTREFRNVKIVQV